MNTQSLDLNKMGLTPLSEIEMQEIEGGSLLGKIVGVVVGAAIGFMIGGPAGAIIGGALGYIAADELPSIPDSLNYN